MFTAKTPSSPRTANSKKENLDVSTYFKTFDFLGVLGVLAVKLNVRG